MSSPPSDQLKTEFALSQIVKTGFGNTTGQGLIILSDDEPHISL